uniref:Fibronectin type-III domain-containing protein n=1 Tax=Scleropages formosus TaxID=113540 RepID=A0A8C9U918_SCLFO
MAVLLFLATWLRSRKQKTSDGLESTRSPLQRGQLKQKAFLRELSMSSELLLSIKLAWANGGSIILGYLVEVKRADGVDWIRCNVPKNLQETKYTVTGLLENTEYQFRVTAVNKVGFGEPSEVPGKHAAKDVLGMCLYHSLLSFSVSQSVCMNTGVKICKSVINKATRPLYGSQFH